MMGVVVGGVHEVLNSNVNSPIRQSMSMPTLSPACARTHPHTPTTHLEDAHSLVRGLIEQAVDEPPARAKAQVAVVLHLCVVVCESNNQNVRG